MTEAVYSFPKQRSAEGFIAFKCGKSLVRVFCMGLLWLASHYALAQGEDAVQLEREFQQLSEQFYLSQARQAPHTKDIDDLYRQVKTAFDSANPVTGITVTLANLDLVKANISGAKVQFLVAGLLEQNAWLIARKIFEFADQSGDPYTTSKFNYLFANYFFRRGDWDKANEYLSAIEFQNALTKSESDYATILSGIILQMHKRHRESIKFYERVPANSDYYAFAQLNKAVAFIRQDWWTDAHIAIKQALEKGIPEGQEELHNRLYLVLGYSQLQQEFYRDARETFRHIGLDSRYVNQALLGIGLAALHQGDFVGALNAFELLKGKKNDDIYVTESYLLLAFVYEQMGQETTASAHYSEAIAYYQGRIASAEAQAARIQTQMAAGANTAMPDLPENLLREIPDSLRENATRLDRFSNQTRDQKLLQKVNLLRRKYNKALLALSRDKLKEQTGVLQSYLSQSQFGVAKLFDSDL